MTEREYRTRLAASQRVLDQAVELAREAGAVFEPEGLPELPELALSWPHAAERWVGRSDGGAVKTLSLEHANEVIRRCKAVEAAVKWLRGLTVIGPAGIDRLLAILEGRS